MTRSVCSPKLMVEAVCLAVLLAFSASTHAATMADWLDGSYRPGLPVVSTTPALAAGPDGGVYVHGRYLVRKDGTVDGGFQSALLSGSMLSAVNEQERDSKGRLVLFGTFTRNDGVSGHAMRLNPDGSVDESFKSPQNGFPAVLGGLRYVWTGLIYTNDSVLVAGGFEWAEKVQRAGVALFDADGTINGGFVSNPGIRGSGRVVATVLDSAGRIVVGGRFMQADGQAAEGLARYLANGKRDFGFEPAIGGQITRLAMQGDGKILVCGQIAGRDAGNHYIYRLLADGKADPAFKVVEVTGSPNSMVLDKAGRIVIAGMFTTVSGVQRTHLARLLADGTVDGSFPTEEGLYGASTLQAQQDGSLLVGGYFLNLLGSSPVQIVRLVPDKPPAVALAALPMERLEVGGELSEVLSEPGVVAVKLTGRSGGTYRIQASEDLHDWTDVGTVTLDDAGHVIVSDLKASDRTQRFFRMVAL